MGLVNDCLVGQFSTAQHCSFMGEKVVQIESQGHAVVFRRGVTYACLLLPTGRVLGCLK
jgi:hypothetical protein